MKLQVEIAIAGSLAGAVCTAAYLGVWRAWRSAAQRQQRSEEQISALKATVQILENRVAELARAAQPVREVESIAAAAEGAGMTELQEPKAETLAVITAAATAFLGRAAHVRSARLIPNGAESVSPWSQQGRFIVQASHNLRTRE